MSVEILIVPGQGFPNGCGVGIGQPHSWSPEDDYNDAGDPFTSHPVPPLNGYM